MRKVVPGSGCKGTGYGLPRARCALAMTLLLQEGRYGIGGRTEASAPTGALLVVRRGGALPLPRATARVAPTEGYKECGGRGDVGIAPYGGVTWSAVGGPSGKSSKRCQWQMKRAGFEEVPRLADTTVAGNRLARRWATAGPYGSVSCGAQGSLFCIEKTTVRVGRSFFIADFTQPWEPRARQPERPRRQPWQQRPSSRRQPSAQP